MKADDVYKGKPKFSQGRVIREHLKKTFDRIKKEQELEEKKEREAKKEMVRDFIITVGFASLAGIVVGICIVIFHS